ncbi:hypothetical protein [Arthrobacter sp. PsM3]|uniref:hypothetical protein n=1 Tax=Arthrobacter sp. PsM3 TaxID=3030531 RepID=UPI00263BAF94|nr:hypothetical protein [Arthrobacter sp. PsM3]MDN4644941.1 hypothetical protein [Arthrobacter sp. PsM3]
MSLNDNIHQLTREHLKIGPDGALRQAPALLAELRNAVTPGNTGSAGGASGPPIPINPEAVDMLARMAGDAKADYREITGNPWPGDLETLLQHIAAMSLAADWHAYLERLTLEWVNQITAFLWPIKPRRKLTGKTCPACGLALHGDERAVCLSLGCWDDDGNLAKIGAWDIECGSCGAEWAGDQVAWLLRALDTPIEDVVHVS